MKHQILIIEDDEKIVKALTIRLRGNGYDVVAAYDAIMAMSQARAHHPDLILLDISMPALTGDKLVGIIRKNSDLDDTKVVLFSERSMEELQEITRNCGADGYVKKTPDPDMFVAEVEECLSAE